MTLDRQEVYLLGGGRIMVGMSISPESADACAHILKAESIDKCIHVSWYGPESLIHV